MPLIRVRRPALAAAAAIVPVDQVLPWSATRFLCGGDNISGDGKNFDDESFYADNLSQSGGAFQQGTTKKFGAGAFQGDGSGDHVSGTSDTDAGLQILTQDFFIGSWIKTTDSQTSNAKGIIALPFVSGAGGPFCHLYMSTGKKLVFAVSGGEAEHVIVGTTTINDGNWHFCAAMRKGGTTISLFVDDNHEGDMPQGDFSIGASSTSSRSYWGTHPSSSSARSWNGHLDEGVIAVGWGIAKDDYLAPTAAFARS